MGDAKTKNSSINGVVLIKDALSFMYGASIYDNIKFCQENNDTIVKCANTFAKIEPVQKSKNTKLKRELTPKEIKVFREFINHAIDASNNMLWKQENDDNY